MKFQRGSGSGRRALIGEVLVLGLFFVGGFPVKARDPAYPKSPRDVLQAYRSMDAEGERLTPAGWYRASKYFVSPERPPQQVVMYVTYGERVTDPSPWTKVPNKAEVDVVCSAIGQVDPSGRFTSRVAPGLAYPERQGDQPLNGPAPMVRPYDLILTDTHWEFGPKLEDPREVQGRPEWRIETFEREPWVTVEAAIRYLARLRDESGSEATRTNAEKSIAALRRLR